MGDANAGYAVVTSTPPDAAARILAVDILAVELSGLEPLAFGLPNRRSHMLSYSPVSGNVKPSSLVPDAARPPGRGLASGRPGVLCRPRVEAP